jgi:hypothetical protein
MAHAFADVPAGLPSLRGGVWCLGGFPGFHPGLRTIAPPGQPQDSRDFRAVGGTSKRTEDGVI